MSEAPLSVERAGGAAWCTLDRPPLNLLEPGLIDAVRATFDALAADRVTRVAILTGGGGAFPAGDGSRAGRRVGTAAWQRPYTGHLRARPAPSPSERLL